jgi:hypothetical protein
MILNLLTLLCSFEFLVHAVNAKMTDKQRITEIIFLILDIKTASKLNIVLKIGAKIQGNKRVHLSLLKSAYKKAELSLVV